MQDFSSHKDNESLEQEFGYYVNLQIWVELLHNVFSLKKGGEAMSGLITFAITKVAGDIFKGEAYQFLKTVVGDVTDNEFKIFNAKRTAKVLIDIYVDCKKKVVDPNKVPLKILLPTIEGLSVEDNEELSEKWANLLKSGISGSDIHPSFPAILSELSPIDARLLEKISSLIDKPAQLRVNSGDWIDIPGVSELRLAHDKSISENEISLSLDNLIRLNLCEKIVLEGIIKVGTMEFDETRRVQVTSLGKKFLEVVNSK